MCHMTCQTCKSVQKLYKNLNPYEADSFADVLLRDIGTNLSYISGDIYDGFHSLSSTIENLFNDLMDMLWRDLSDIKVLLNEIRNAIFLNTEELERQTIELKEQTAVLKDLAADLDALMKEYGVTGGGSGSNPYPDIGGGDGGGSTQPNYGQITLPGAFGDDFAHYGNVVYVVWDIPVLRQMLLTMVGLFLASLVLFGKRG